MQASNSIPVPANNSGQIEAVVTLAVRNLDSAATSVNAIAAQDKHSDWAEFLEEDFDTVAPFRCSPLDDF
jgi:hypothetical protein